MDDLKTSALILSRKPKKEFHGTVTVFTRSLGKMHLTAMGLYKMTSKLSAILLPSNLVYLTLAKGRNWHITGAKLHTGYAARFFEPRILYLSSIIREVCMSLVPSEEPDQTLYDMMVKCYEILATETLSIKNKELVVYRFILAAISTQGLLPEFTLCSKDGKKMDENTKRYWVARDGVVCENCAVSLTEKKLLLPSTIVNVGTYTTHNTLSKDERSAISSLIQGIVTDAHAGPLQSLQVWEESLVKS